jgi:peptidoglycan/LPS O-acetylase OafA/YrhL
MDRVIGALVLRPGVFRLLLAVAVVVCHLSRWDVGRLAVLLFFFLSGFWVTQVWIAKFKREGVGSFYLSRYFRIIPLYLIVVAMTALASGAAPSANQWALLGLATTGGDILGVSWSLDIELQFYLLVPLLVAIALAIPWWVSALAVTALAVASWALEPIFQFAIVTQYLPAFALGMAAFLTAWKPSQKLAMTSLAGFGAVTALALALPMFSGFLDNARPEPFHRDIFAFFWMLPLLPYVVRSLNVKSGPLDRSLGDLSYPLYLVHWPLIAIVREHMGRGLDAKALAVLAAVLLTLALYVVVDRPIDKVRRRLFEPRPIKAKPEGSYTSTDASEAARP